MSQTGGQGVRYTWGLVHKRDGVVAMFNVPREEAIAIEARSGGELLCRPVSTRKYMPGQRGLKGSQVHGC